MKKDIEHLNLDFDFLNQVKSKSNKKDSEKVFNINWKIVGVVVAIITFLIVVGNSSSNSNITKPTYDSNSGSEQAVSNNSYVNSNDDVITGQYRCSRSNNATAVSIEPSKSYGQTLDSITSDFSLESDRLDREKRNLSSEYVDETDQYSIDRHNEEIDAYNSKLNSYKYRLRSHSNDVDTYNSQVQTYNNFLQNNCRKAY